MKKHVMQVTVRPYREPGARQDMQLYELLLDGVAVRRQISHLGMEEVKTELANKCIGLEDVTLHLLPADGVVLATPPARG